jgi:hypothetical protein
VKSGCWVGMQGGRRRGEGACALPCHVSCVPRTHLPLIEECLCRQTVCVVCLHSSSNSAIIRTTYVGTYVGNLQPT